MKINKTDKSNNCLSKLKVGSPFRFTSQLHKKHAPDALFIKCAIISAYYPDTRKISSPDLIGVVNLGTGHLCYVRPVREVVLVDAEIVTR